MMEYLLDKLALLSKSWKEQFAECPDIPLEWSVDEEGILLLDGIWVCPVKKVIGYETYVTPVSMELKLKDGFLTVIVVEVDKKHEVGFINRALCA